MKSVRLELASVLTVLAVPAALALVFPYGAIGFRPGKRPSRPAASAAFVTLSDEEQALAMRSAKSAWQVDVSGERQMRADLSVGDLPEDPSFATLDVAAGPSRSKRSIVESPLAAYPRTSAAPAAKPIAREADADKRVSAFAKSDLLKID